MSLKPGMSSGWKPVTPVGVPTSIFISKLLKPRPNNVSPMPLMPCSACIVTLITAINSPMSAPVNSATTSPSQGLPVCSTA